MIYVDWAEHKSQFFCSHLWSLNCFFLPIASVNSDVAANDSVQSKCKYLSFGVMAMVFIYNPDSSCFSVSRLMCVYLQHLSAGLQLRLQAIQNRVNNQCLQGPASSTFPFALRKWLQCTQFKMAQVEIQSSEAASQFYPMWCDILQELQQDQQQYVPTSILFFKPRYSILQQCFCMKRIILYSVDFGNSNSTVAKLKSVTVNIINPFLSACNYHDHA